LPSVLFAFSAWTLLGVRKSIRPVKLSNEVLVICLKRGADCLHMVQLMPLHPKTLQYLASLKSKLVLPFWYRLTQVVLEKRPINGCSSSSIIISIKTEPLTLSLVMAIVSACASQIRSNDFLALYKFVCICVCICICIYVYDAVAHPCRQPLFSCKNMRCIEMRSVLDGKDDCLDQSDEGFTVTVARLILCRGTARRSQFA